MTQLTTAAPAAQPRAKRRSRLRRGGLAPYLFVLPNMLVFAIFTIWPAINGFNLSLYDSRDGVRFEYRGLENYQAIVSDATFWAAARSTALFTIGYVVLNTVLAVVLAMMLQAQRRGRGALSAAFFLPILISPIVVGVIWRAALDRRLGMVNQALAGIGIEGPAWLVDTSLALACVIAVGVWIHFGFYAMIVLSGLQSIDTTLYEAASIDGASTWQRIRSITLPLLRPTVLVVVMLSTITGFQAYDYIYTLTGGGPVGATTLIVQYIFDNAFSYPIQYGLAAAAGVILFFVIFGVTLLHYLVGRRSESI